MRKFVAYTFIFLICISAHAQKFEGLAMTPPMGWNSWNTFETNINEQLVKQTADIMVSSGMKDAGYQYIVLDDGWMAKERDSITGDLVPDPVKFPHGMKMVVDYVHAKGLKFGLYNCAGTKTCAGYPGTRGYEYQDARFYASLGIDYLKYDWCNTEGLTAKEAYTTMSKALKAARRPIVFSLCEWGTYQPWEWAAPVGHLWRISGDIYPCFDCEFNHGSWSSWGVMKIVDMRKHTELYAGPDHWNDFDMMEVGNGMNVNEDRAHFSMWCMLASPLIAGNDLRKMKKETLSILTNKDVIAINQDKRGMQAFRWRQKDNDSIDMWVKPLKEGLAVCFLNRSGKPILLNHAWNTIAYTTPNQPPLKPGEKREDEDATITFPDTHPLRIWDVWKNTQIGTTANRLSATIQPHDVLLLKLIQ
jgi:alpha-galactosidase